MTQWPITIKGNDNMALENIIKMQMRKKGLSQTDISDALGVKQPSVSKWVRGVGYPTGSNVVSLCKILSISPNTLFSWNGEVMNFKTTLFGLDVDVECTFSPEELMTHDHPGCEAECQLDSITHKESSIEIDDLPDEQTDRIIKEAFMAASQSYMDVY